MFGDKGVNQLMQYWGNVLLKKYQNTRPFRYSDPTLNYLGYSTDNGAYYYYQTENNLNYEDTMLAIRHHADDLKIPFH